MNRLEGFLPAFRHKARSVPDRVFAVFGGRPIRFSDLDHMSDALAAGLRRLGLARGDRVAVMLRNSPAALAVPFGLGKAGVVWVPVNVQLRGESLRHILEHSAPRAVLAEALRLAEELAAKPPVAMRLDKQRFREMTEAGFRDCLEAGIRIQRESYGSGEPARMMELFLSRGKAGG